MLEKFYDMSCNKCGRYLSTEYDTGMDKNKGYIKKWAILSGWIIKSEKETYYPKCKNNIPEKGI